MKNLTSYSFTFTEEELQKVFDALIERPYKDVAELIANIHGQLRDAHEANQPQEHHEHEESHNPDE